MNTTTLLAILTSVVTAPVLATLIGFVKDRRKDKASEDQIRVGTMREIIDELRTEVARLRETISDLEEEMETLKNR